MTLFKYKAPTPFEHIADILINERLFCCPYYRMNDPFEGVFLESIEMDGARFSVLTTPDELMAPEDALDRSVPCITKCLLCSSMAHFSCRISEIL